MSEKLTIFAVPKPFTDPHIAMIQNNAIKSWTMLKPEPRVLLICDDDGVAEAADQFGCEHVTGVRVNAWGTPLVDDVFRIAESMAEDVVCYVNADVLLMQSFMEALDLVREQQDQFLMVSQRWDWYKPRQIDFRPGWVMRVLDDARKNGRMHNPFGIDYFCFTTGVFPEIPPFILGMYAWDNFLIRDAIEREVPVVDVTTRVFLIHQSHPEKLSMEERQNPGSNPQRLRNLELAKPLIQIGGGKPGCVTASQFVLNADGKVVPRKQTA